MIWKWIAVCMACLLLLGGCTKAPSSDQTSTTTTTTVQEENKAPPSITLNGTQTLKVGSYQWSRMEDGELVIGMTDAPHPYKYFLEKYPMFYTNDTKTITFSFEEVSPIKEVKVVAYKMSAETQQSLPITVTSAKDANGKTVYTAELLTDDFYAYVIKLFWDRYGENDYSTYFFYSKAQ